MKRLVHVTTVPITLNFYRGHVGYLQSKGFTVSAISSPGPQLDEFGAALGVETRAVSMNRRLSPLRDVVSLARLLFALAKLRPDLVHATTPKAGLLGPIAARLVGAKVVVSVFGLPQMTRTGAMKKLLDATTRFSCRLAHRVWCDSYSIREHLITHKLCAPGKIFVAGSGSVNGVDAARFDQNRYDAAATRAEWGIPAGAFLIGYVGRIVRDKGIHELAAAWRTLRDRHPDVRLMLVGEPEDSDPISADVDRFLRDDPRVHFTGQQSDVARLLSALDVFVMPSYREGFGVTNIEAASMGLPVVSTRIPGCVDSVMDGATGTLVPPRDAEALAEAIERYYADPDLRARHGAAGRQRVLAEFRPERVWADVAAVYESLLGEQV